MIKLDCKKRFQNSSGAFELDLKMEIKRGEFVAIYGKSGSGKTTTLRLIAGFERPDSGIINIDDRVVFSDSSFVAPQKRDIGYLFQDFALFPNMNVIENLLFAKKNIKMATKLLDLVGLSHKKNSAILNLSGGEKQRVALARSLMREPKILLLDEPLSSLDEAIRQKLQDYLININLEFKLITILVSHDVSEIYKLANKIFEMKNGRIINSGKVDDIFCLDFKFNEFAFVGKILDISKKDSVYLVTILVANQIGHVVLTKQELGELKISDNIKLELKYNNFQRLNIE